MSYEHKIKVMTNQEQYDAQQEYNYFEMLVNTKEYVTKDEYEFIIAYDKTEKNNFTRSVNMKWR
jgi:penicillin V acylase-like amidase (Ntn superfamily)